MLGISPLRTNNDGSKNNNNNNNTTMEASFSIEGDDFPDFPGGNLLDSIDFDDLFMGMHNHDPDPDKMLPDLEMDPELLVEFSLSGGEESSEVNNNSSIENINPNEDQKVVVLINDNGGGFERREKVVDGGGGCKDDLVKSKKESESDSTTTTMNSSFKESGKGKKSSSLHSKMGSTNHNNNSSNNYQGKRKAKVDWTPELHRRFVQAVEQLGVDKAVPSRILELMGIDCLTRHNIASHLQKYRSHKKHLLAREAEAATWTQKRQMYGVAMGGGKGGANISPWHPPIMAFPPIIPIHHHPFRPLHVWGHPTMDLQSRIPMWPKQAIPPPSPPPPLWTPPLPHPPPTDPSFWHSPHHRVPNTMAPAVPCFPQPMAATRFTAPSVPVPGIPSQAMYRPERGRVVQPHPGFDAHPTKESIDAALGDVLAKPYLPLPIGLKPPSIDSVLVELQRQGVPKIPPQFDDISPAFR